MATGDYIFLVEATGWHLANAVSEVFRWASGEDGFTTRIGDTPPATTYENRVIDPGNFEIFIFKNSTTGGASQVGAGNVVINNGDTRLDYLRNYAFDGRSIKIYYGPNNGSYPSDFTLIFSGTIEKEEYSSTKITFRIRDRQGLVASKPIQTTLYAGSNSLPSGVEGVADDIKGKPKPVMYGTVFEINPVLVNTSKNIYQLNWRAINSVDAVYVGGALQTPGTSRASIAALESNTPTGGTYDWYLGSSSDGAYIRFATTPDKIVTCNATQGANAAARTVAQIVKNILKDLGGFTDDDLDLTSFTSLDTACNYVVGIWQPAQEGTIGAFIDEVCQSIQAFWSIDSTGKVFVGRLTAPSGTALTTIEEDIIINQGQRIEFVSTADETKGIPPYSYTCNYKKIYTTQTETDLSGIAAADLARVNYLKDTYRQAISNASGVTTKHLLSKPMEFFTLLTNETDAQAECDRRKDMYKVERDYVNVAIHTSRDPNIALSQVVTLKVNRFGLNNGKDFRVLGKTFQYANNQVIYSLWG